TLVQRLHTATSRRPRTSLAAMGTPIDDCFRRLRGTLTVLQISHWAAVWCACRVILLRPHRFSRELLNRVPCCGIGAFAKPRHPRCSRASQHTASASCRAFPRQLLGCCSERSLTRVVGRYHAVVRAQSRRPCC